jgi:hypothetical protein
MKGVLIGTDYLEQGDIVKILEINTNSTIFRDGVDLLDFNPLFNVITSNNISELHYIYTEGVSVTPVGEGENKFIRKLEILCSENNVTFYEYQVQRNSVTVPYIEDDDTKFILRQAYDTYAILDSNYTSDKFEFFSLMSGSEYVPKTYYSSSEDQLFLDTLDSVDYTSNHPNLVEKDRYPSYDITQYPKLSLLPNTDDLDSKKQSLISNQNHLLQEFVYDDKNIVDGYYSAIRSFDIIYGSNLDIIHMGAYRHSALAPMDFCENEFQSGSFDLTNKTRTKYINKNLIKDTQIYHTDLESNILMSDDSLLSVDNINEGDVIKTISFPGYNTSSLMPWEQMFTVDYINDTFGYASSSLISIEGQEIDTLMVEISFNTGEKYLDSYNTAYYVELSGSNDTRFLPVNKMIEGDKIVFLNKDINEFYVKEVTSLGLTHVDGMKIFNLDFEPLDYFLVDINGDNHYAIMHNRCEGCSWSGPLAICGNNWCDANCPPCASMGRPPQK